MLDSQNRLQNYFKNTKTTKFLLKLAFYTSEGHTCKVLSFYDFWFTFNYKFCSPYPIVDFYAYLITKIGNRNLNSIRLSYLACTTDLTCVAHVCRPGLSISPQYYDTENWTNPFYNFLYRLGSD